MRKLVIAGVAVLVLFAAVAAASQFTLSALPEPGRTETFLATKAKHYLVRRSSRDGIPPAPADRQAAMKEGDRLFGTECGACHGASGHNPTDAGRWMYPRAADLTSRASQSYSDQEIFWIIKNGIRLSGMPAFGKVESDEHIWDLVFYVRTLPKAAPGGGGRWRIWPRQHIIKRNKRGPKNMAVSEAVPLSPLNVCPLLTGMAIPQVTLRTVNNEAFDLNSAVRQQPSVLVFYRGGWWPHCNEQLVQLREIESQLKNLGVLLLAISPDQPSKVKETIDKHKMGFLLLSDSDMAAARSFRVACKLDDATLAELKKYNIDVEQASGQKHHMLPVPAVFLVATNGLIQFEYVNPDYKVRLDPELLLAAAKIMLGS